MGAFKFLHTSSLQHLPLRKENLLLCSSAGTPNSNEKIALTLSNSAFFRNYKKNEELRKREAPIKRLSVK